MKKYTEQIIKIVSDRISEGTQNLFCIEGIETPVIYKKICERFSKNDKADFTAKLTSGKYEEFMSEKREDWQKSLEYLEDNGFVEHEGVLTKWRNDIKKGQKTSITMLMGVEDANDDKGSLGDFYKISPENIIDELNGKYGEWFRETVESEQLGDDCITALNNVYMSIFKHTNIDLLKLSSFADNTEKMPFNNAQELIKHVFNTLNTEWGIPFIGDEKRIPRLQGLQRKGKIKIIDDAYTFIHCKNRAIFSKNERKIDGFLNKYAEEKDIDTEKPFPEDNAVFDDYEDFKNSLKEFINGKNREINRNRFLKLDYSIISDVFDMKTDDKPKSEDKKPLSVKSEPVEFFARMIAYTIKSYKELRQTNPNEIIIKFEGAKLSHCSDMESDSEDNKSGELRDSYADLCLYLGGVLEFLNCDDEIDIHYKDNIDPFTMEFFEDNTSIIGVARRYNSNCEISFKATAKAENIKEKQYEFKWTYSPYAEWKNCFAYFRKLVCHEDKTELPFITEVKNLEEALTREDGVDFYSHIMRLTSNNLDEKFDEQIKSYFGGEESEYLEKIKGNALTWAKKMNKAGFFSALNEARVFVNEYEKFMLFLQGNFKNYTSVQSERLYLLSNIFMLADNEEFIGSAKCKGLVAPIYNPAMLEKLDAKFIFMRDGIQEILSKVKDGEAADSKIADELERLDNLSEITQANDCVWTGSKYLPCRQVWSGCALYYGDDLKGDFEGDGAGIGMMAENNEDELEYFTSPASAIISNNIIDYINTFPARKDGLNIVFISPKETQPVIAGIEAVKRSAEKADETLNMCVKLVYTDNTKNSGEYLRSWVDKLFEKESDVNIEVYAVYHEIKSKNDAQRLGNELEGYDLCFVYDILSDTDIRFDRYDENSRDRFADKSKFPMLFVPDTQSVSGSDRRSVNMSQLQFDTSRAHVQFIHSIGNKNNADGTYKLMQELNMSEAKKAVIDEAHSKCRWVVCVDKLIDKKLIRSDGHRVIGFATGEGCHGELNVTVSARDDIISDIRGLLEYRLKEKFKKWNKEIIERAARYCMDKLSSELDGSRMLKALNPKDYEVHNFLAYILMVGILRIGSGEEKQKYILRDIINLDSYRHWFGTKADMVNSDNNRPDFAIIEIERNLDNLNPDKQLVINIRVIECKMSVSIEHMLDKAKKQVEKGVSTLSALWNRENDSVSRRYWFNQLYRALVFTELNIEDNKKEYTVIRDKIYNVLNGNFHINWYGDIYAFDLSNSSDEICDNVLYTELEELAEIKEHIAGQLYIQKNLLSEEDRASAVYEFEDEGEREEHTEAEEKISDYKEHEEQIVVKEEPITEGENEKNTKEENESGNMQISRPDLSKVRFLLGADMKTGEKYYWEFGNKKLNNRHLLINGNSGCGKTYCIQGLLAEASRQGIPSIIFDYTSGFVNSKLEPLFVRNCRVKQNVVKLQKIAINPFARQKILIDEIEIPEDAVDIAQRIASVFVNVYKFGEQQSSCIYQAIKKVFEEKGESMGFKDLEKELTEQNSSNSRSVLSKIKPFLDIDAFGSVNKLSWSEIHNSDGEVNVIQFAGYDRELQVMLTQILLWDIWNYAMNNGSEDKPLILVMDEAQNLDHGEKSPSAKILQEGRKFGISAWYATQFMKPQLDDAEIQRLQQAGQKLYFSPPENGRINIAKNIDETDYKTWLERLKFLQKGECVSVGSMERKGKWSKYPPRIIKVASMEERMNGMD